MGNPACPIPTNRFLRKDTSLRLPSRDSGAKNLSHLMELLSVGIRCCHLLKLKPLLAEPL